MKKLVLTLSILGLLIANVSCEPDTNKEISQDEIYTVDKEDIERPGNQGGGS